jgi:hypothetical protein
MISLYCRSNSSWFVYNLIQQSDWLNKNVMVLRGSFVGPNISMSVLKHSKGSDDSIVEVGGQDVPASWDPPASPSRLAIGAGVTCWFLIQVLQLTLESVQTFLLSFWRIVHAQVNLSHCMLSLDAFLLVIVLVSLAFLANQYVMVGGVQWILWPLIIRCLF